MDRSIDRYRFAQRVTRLMISAQLTHTYMGRRAKKMILLYVHARPSGKGMYRAAGQSRVWAQYQPPLPHQQRCATWHLWGGGGHSGLKRKCASSFCSSWDHLPWRELFNGFDSKKKSKQSKSIRRLLSVQLVPKHAFVNACCGEPRSAPSIARLAGGRTFTSESTHGLPRFENHWKFVSFFNWHIHMNIQMPKVVQNEKKLWLMP